RRALSNWLSAVIPAGGWGALEFTVDGGGVGGGWFKVRTMVEMSSSLASRRVSDFAISDTFSRTLRTSSDTWSTLELNTATGATTLACCSVRLVVKLDCNEDILADTLP